MDYSYKLNLKEKFVIGFLTNSVFVLFKLLGLTYRHIFINRQVIDDAKNANKGKPHILAIWHQNIFAGLQVENQKHIVLISPSKDGEFVSVTCKKLGHEVVRGSSNKKPHVALREMFSLMSRGIPAAISIDGPRGPLYDVKSGIIELARKTQAIIVPMSPIPQKYWSFKSWDKFRLPKPFTKIVVVYGEPFTIPEDVSREEFDQFKIKIKNILFDAEKIAIKYLIDELK